jgi:hypothetical protein
VTGLATTGAARAPSLFSDFRWPVVSGRCSGSEDVVVADVAREQTLSLHVAAAPWPGTNVSTPLTL